MKKLLYTLALVLVGMTAQAQTMNVSVGNVTDQFPAAQTGEMTFMGGTQMTILGKTYDVSEITKMWTDDTKVKDNEVNVVYSGDAALVYVAGNIAQYITAAVSGAHVIITQSADITNDLINDGTFSEITYNLSGTSTDGSLTLGGSAKCTVAVNGLELTNPNGAPINITNGKRIQLSAKNGTTNTLTDCANGSQKACVYSKGQLQLQGKGTLNVVGNTKHGIKSGDYITVKNLTLNITKAVGDGINCEEYFQMKSGAVTISGVGDDGIQCDLGGTISTGETTGHEDEDSGNIYLEGGTLKVTVTAAATKGVKAAGDMTVSDGDITITTTGNGAYDSDEKDAKGCCGLKADGNMTISGGTLTLKSTGSGGKCIKADNLLTISGGNISATATGSQYKYSSSITASPKAIKAGTRTAVSSAPPGGGGGRDNTKYTYTGGIVITGGTIYAKSTNHEAIESKATIEISGGYVYAEAGDDAINSGSDFTITGGYVMGNSSGNDGLDANGNFYIKGGNVFAVASRQPEVGIDANTEGGYKLYITGGNVAAIGGLENGSSLSGVSSKSVSYSKGSWYTLKSGSTTAFSFKVPSNNSMGSSMTICTPSTPSVASQSSTPSGTTIWNGYGVITTD